MDSKEFSKIRQVLGKTQNQMARLLCVSPKAIQSFEQGWRNVPAYIERETLLILALKKFPGRTVQSCWEIKNCPHEWRDNCIAWELEAGHICWFATGTFCQGKVHESWEKKIQSCRECEVYKSMLSVI